MSQVKIFLFEMVSVFLYNIYIESRDSRIRNNEARTIQKSSSYVDTLKNLLLITITQQRIILFINSTLTQKGIAMTTKTPNYTPEQTLEIVNLYVNEGVTPEVLAAKFSKTARSVIAKLSREGVYKSREKASGERRRPKADMITDLEFAYQMPAGSLQSLEKASWEAVNQLHSKTV